MSWEQPQSALFSSSNISLKYDVKAVDYWVTWFMSPGHCLQGLSRLYLGRPLYQVKACTDASTKPASMPLLRVIIAAHLVHVASLQAPLLCGFDFVVAPLVDPSYHRPALQKHDCPLVPPGTRTELMLTSAQWGGQVG